MTRLSARAVNRATLARQLLLERSGASVVEAVERLAGMQAQEPKHPHVGLWTRLIGGDLAAAVRDRSVVRATLMRGTLHLFSAADYQRFRMTLQPVLAGAMAVLGDRGEGLQPEQVVAAAREVLADGPLRFGDIRAGLAARFPKVDERALGYTTRMLVPLVMVPDSSRWGYPANAPFTLASEWLDVALSADDALDELVLRYLAAFGPATPADFQTWSGLPRPRPVFDRLLADDRLEVFTDDSGKELLDVPDGPRPDPDTTAPVRFLPEFDNLLLSHAKRDRIIADEHKPAVFTKNLRIRSTYLVDGRVAGLWAVAVKRGVASLQITPFGPRPRLDAEGTELLRFLAPDAKSYQVVTVE